MDYDMIEPGDIADVLIIGEYAENGEADRDDLTDALYQLKAIAQNKYNSDYWRTLYKTLQNIALKS